MGLELGWAACQLGHRMAHLVTDGDGIFRAAGLPSTRTRPARISALAREPTHAGHPSPRKASMRSPSDPASTINVSVRLDSSAATASLSRNMPRHKAGSP